MYKKKYSMVVLVYALCTFCFCFNNGEGWCKDYSPNVHWLFCIDTSGSMKTKGHADLLKAITGKITTEFTDVNNNMITTGDRITIMSFDKEVRLEATALYQTENDLIAVRENLAHMNHRSGSLTFVSEAIVHAIDVINKYDDFFYTNALYVFTDGKSEPYSLKWSKEKIDARKKRDAENFNRISLVGKDNGTNIWVGVLKWEAFDDARSLVEKIGKGGHMVDLTDFSRLSLTKALSNFAHTVRSSVTLSDLKEIDFGAIPYKSDSPYTKKITLDIQTDKLIEAPEIVGRIHFDPDNPSEISEEYPLKIKTTEEKMVLSFEIPESSSFNPGTYKGKVKLFPSENHFGAMVIEPSQFDVTFKKSGYMSYYLWRVMLACAIGILLLSFMIVKIRKRMPIKLKTIYS